MFLPCFDAYLQTLITNNDIAIMKYLGSPAKYLFAFL